MAADLAQPRERGQHVHLALVEALLLDGLHDLVAAAAQFGQVKFPLLVAERTIAPLLDAVGQILGDVFLQAAQQQRTQLGRKPFARDALGGFGFLAARRLFHRRGIVGHLRARFVGFDKLFLIAEVAGLDEIHDAPQIEQPVFQRRAGERQAVLGLELLDRLRDLRAGILDELRLVQNHRAEREFLQFLQIAPQQRVVGHNQIVLRNLLAQIVPRRAAFEHQHLQAGREPVRLAPPVVQHGRRADDERRLGIFRVAFLEPRQPRQRLQRFAQAHVVGQNAAQLDLREVAEKIESVLLIRAQLGLQALGQVQRTERL